MGDVAAVLHPVKADAPNGFIGAGDGGLQRSGPRSDSKDASSMGHNLAIDEAGAGVEDASHHPERWRAPVRRSPCPAAMGRDSRPRP